MPLALRIGRYVVKHGLSMPEDNYRRPAPTVLTEEICNPILNLATTYAGAELSGYIAMLDELAEIVADSDMPDEVRAKLCKVRAFCRRGTQDAETKGEALKLFREAMSLNPGAGVKREIASLVSVLKKAPQTSAAGGDAVDETSFSDAAATETHAAEKGHTNTQADENGGRHPKSHPQNGGKKDNENRRQRKRLNVTNWPRATGGAPGDLPVMRSFYRTPTA